MCLNSVVTKPSDRLGSIAAPGCPLIGILLTSEVISDQASEHENAVTVIPSLSTENLLAFSSILSFHLLSLPCVL